MLGQVYQISIFLHWLYWAWLYIFPHWQGVGCTHYLVKHKSHLHKGVCCAEECLKKRIIHNKSSLPGDAWASKVSQLFTFNIFSFCAQLFPFFTFSYPFIFNFFPLTFHLFFTFKFSFFFLTFNFCLFYL